MVLGLRKEEDMLTLVISMGIAGAFLIATGKIGLALAAFVSSLAGCVIANLVLGGRD